MSHCVRQAHDRHPPERGGGPDTMPSPLAFVGGGAVLTGRRPERRTRRTVVAAFQRLGEGRGARCGRRGRRRRCTE